MKSMMYIMALLVVLAGVSCKDKKNEKEDHSGHNMKKPEMKMKMKEKVNVKTDKIIIKNGWARENIPPTKMSAGFMLIENPTDQEDVLVKAESDISNVVEVHEMIHKDDKMTMREAKGGVSIAAKGKLELKPGSYHIMFIDLKKDIKEKEEVKMTLHFKNAGEHTITVPVKKLMMKGHHHK